MSARVRDRISAATPAEAEVLDHVLREIRNASALGEQLLITFDPWSSRRDPETGGAYVFFAYNERGVQYEVEGVIRKVRRRGKVGGTKEGRSR